ncbi:MAG: RDD family protein [Bacilli bacterium]|jgi:uncharacterized RDD family membrane protein YckC
METSKTITLAPTYKRLLAVIIDFLIIAFIGFCLFVFAGIPIVNRFFQGNQLVNEATRIQTESYLFNNKGGEIYLFPYAEENEETPLGLIEEGLYRYYVESEVAVSTGAHLADADAYYDQILQRMIIVNDVPTLNPDCLFDFDQGAPLDPWNIPIKGSTTAEQRQEFYLDAYQNAIDDLENNHPRLNQINQLLERRMVIGILIGFLVSLVFFQAIIPLILKEGATLGKRLFNIGVVNALGYRMNKIHHLFRNITVIFLHYLLIFLALPFVSLMFMFFRKDQRNLVDLLAATLVVDTKYSIIHDSAQAEASAQAKIEEVKAQNRLLRDEYEKEEKERRRF